MANIGYLQVTRDCNQHCRFCSNPPSGLDRTLEEDRRLVDDFVARGYQGVILTGGEPTLVGHLPELVRHCVAVGLEPRMITNGQRIANPRYLAELYDAGLRIIHCSLHSHRPEVHNFITDHGKAWEYIVTAMANCADYADLSLRVNTVLNRHNADHLDQVMEFLVDNFAHVRHVIFNGLDPSNERCDQNRDVYYRLRDIEIPLQRAMRVLDRAGVTFRVERVPLCYMLDYAHLSTETRKLVKQEERMIHFLDGKGTVRQAPGAFYHRKTERCAACSVDAICGGLFERGDMYDPDELYPLFVDADAIRRRVLGDAAADEATAPSAATHRVAASSIHLPVV
jgi:MoaA/NifB/PqqE/SkfB family radical SAM enzyme